MSIVASEPFDCSRDDDGDDTLEILSCIKNGPQWWQIGRQVAWSFAVWFFIVVSSPATTKIWKFICNDTSPFWVQQYVGTKYRQAQNLQVEAVLCFAQVFGSLFSVWMWVIKSYSIHNATVSDEIYAIECMCVVLSFSHTLFERIKFDFSVKHALSFGVFLDCLTLPPLIMQRSGPWAGGSWLTLGYLRAYHCLTPIKRLVELDLFDRILSNFAQYCIVAVLECILVVFSIAGTLWIMESLGDIEGFSDQFFDSGMGDISFFQMIYFTFVTISTVGFGDYSPTTVLSRFFIIFAILGGVSFFSHISVHIINLVELESSGRGKFYPSKKSGRGHILVMGGGVTCGSISVLETFMGALCRSDTHYDTPDIVLMGQTSCSKEVRAMLKCEWAMGYELQYFIGCPLDAEDLMRVRASEASMVFIIADFLTSDTNKEDKENALIAAALQKLNPNVQYRLMLCSMNSRELGSNIGLSEFNCFSLEALKAGMLGTSHRCPGFSTFILNLGLPDLPIPNSPFSSEIVDKDNYGIWLREYGIGCSYETYGFLPINFLVGLTFKEASLKTIEISDVLLLAAQIDGGIRINPTNAIIKKTTVLYALSRHAHAVNMVAKNNDVNVASWIKQFQKNRKRGTFAKRHHNKFVCVRSEEEVELLYASSLGESSNHLQSATPQSNSVSPSNGGGGNGNGVFKKTNNISNMNEAIEKSKKKNQNQNQSSDLSNNSSTHLQSFDGGGNAGDEKEEEEETAIHALEQNTSVRTIGSDDESSDIDTNENVSTKITKSTVSNLNFKNLKSSTSLEDDKSLSALNSLPSRSKFNSFSQKAKEAKTAKKRGLHLNVSKIKMDATIEDIDILRKQVKQGGHTVIIILEDHDEFDQQTVWEQLSVIVNCLIFAKDITPLVVIHSVSALHSRCRWMKKQAHQLEQVKISFCVGDVLSPITLQAGGCHTCARILTLAPSAPVLERKDFDGVEMVIRSDEKKDENNILLMMILEEYKAVWNRHDIHIMFDWYSPTAMNLLPLPHLTENKVKRISGDYNLIFSSLDESESDSIQDPLSKPPQIATSSPRMLPPIQRLSTEKLKLASTSLRFYDKIKIKPEENDKTLIRKSIDQGTQHIKKTLNARLTQRQISREKKKSVSEYVSAIQAAKQIKYKTSSFSSSPNRQSSFSSSFSSSPTSASSPTKKKINQFDNQFSKKQQMKIHKEKIIKKNKKLLKSKSFNEKSHDSGSGSDSNNSFNDKKNHQEKEEQEGSDSSDSSDSEDETSYERHEMSRDDLEFSNRFPRGNCRFAAGYTIPKPFVASLYSMAYYTPGFLELIEALLNPSEYDQKSIPWLFKVPRRFEEEPYSAVARELLEAGTIPLGLLRPGGIEAGTPFPYVVTLVPTSSLMVNSEDSIYVLAEETWANEEALKLGFYSSFHKARKKVLTKVSSMFADTSSSFSASPAGGRKDPLSKSMPFLDRKKLTQSLNLKSKTSGL